MSVKRRGGILTKKSIMKILMIISMLMIAFLFCNCVVYAGVENDLSNINVDLFNPSIDGTDGAITVIEGILNFLLVLGVVVTVISIALIGFSAILGSASEKADAQGKYIGIVIGAILITSVCAIAKFIIHFAENI